MIGSAIALDALEESHGPDDAPLLVVALHICPHERPIGAIEKTRVEPAGRRYVLARCVRPLEFGLQFLASYPA